MAPSTPPDGVAIRAATVDDLPALERLRRALWPDVTDAETAGAMAGSYGPYRCFLAEVRGEAVGFAEVGMRSYAEGCTSSPVPYLEGIWVAPDRRRAGIGRALVEAAARWARAEGHTEFASDTDPDNRASAAFHRALGFREADRIVCFARRLKD